jgi:hypothetical protein
MHMHMQYTTHTPITHNNTGGKGKGAVEIDATYGVLCGVMLL